MPNVVSGLADDTGNREGQRTLDLGARYMKGAGKKIGVFWRKISERLVDYFRITRTQPRPKFQLLMVGPVLYSCSPTMLEALSDAHRLR